MKNKGFSLLELIVAMAIMAILATGVIGISGAHYGWRVNKAMELIGSTMNSTLVQAMSKGNVKGMVIYQLDETYYAAIVRDTCYDPTASSYNLEPSKVVKSVELGHQPITITVKYKELTGTGTKEVLLTNQTSQASMTVAAELLYDKGSGAIQSVNIAGTDYNYAGIQVKCHGKDSEIEIYPATGKFIEK